MEEGEGSQNWVGEKIWGGGKLCCHVVEGDVPSQLGQPKLTKSSLLLFPFKSR